MKDFFFLLLIFNYSLLSINAQTQFQRTIGGAGVDAAFSIIQTTGGGYALAGYTTSFGAGNTDFYIVKLDGNGTLQWTRTVGGTSLEYAYSIIRTTDGGYALAGITDASFGAGSRDIYIVKLDASGTLQWSRTVGGTGEDGASSIMQTTDGGYLVVGYTISFGVGGDMYIVKLDGSGTLQWSQTIGGTGYDFAESIMQTTDGGYALAGTTFSFAGLDDFYIVKLDGSGALQWSRTVGGTSNERAYSIVQTTDGGYAVAGQTNSFGAGGYDLYIVKLSGSGTLQWSRTIGGAADDFANSIIQTTDGGYAVAGSTFSFGAGSFDMYIVKLDGNGTLQWSKTVGGTGSDAAYSLIQTTDNGYAVAGGYFFGVGNYDAYIVKLNSSGNTCGNSSTPSSISGTGGTLGTTTPTGTFPTSIVTSPTSLTNTGGTVTNICFVGIQPISTEIPNQFSLSQNYPNPFNPMTNVKFQMPNSGFVQLKVFDVLGREVATLFNEELKAGSYEINWDASSYPSGVYFYKIIAGDFTDTRKMILIK